MLAITILYCAGYHVIDSSELLMWFNEMLVGKLEGFDALIIVGGCIFFIVYF